MIPAIETRLRTELERRILEAVPQLQTGEGTDRSEHLVLHIEKRTPKRCVQEQSDCRILGTVEARVSVMQSLREDLDMSPLLGSFMDRPYLGLSPDTHAVCELQQSELAEGPHLDQDVFLFRVVYPIFDLLPGKTWEEPRIHGETASDDLGPFPPAAAAEPEWEPR